MAALRRFLWTVGNEDDISTEEIRKTNLQISDRVYVDGVRINQDGNGAPIEQASPLGYHVGWVSHSEYQVNTAILNPSCSFP